MMVSCFGCKDSVRKSGVLSCTGTPYDLYIVMPEKMLPNFVKTEQGDQVQTNATPLYDSLCAIFKHPMECTPNGDEYFYVSTIKPEAFLRGVRTLGNIVQVDISADNAEQPVVRLERDKYARGQLIVKMYGRDQQSLADYIMQMQEQLRDVFVKSEINRAIVNLRRDNARLEEDRLLHLQNVSMLIPYAIKKPGVGASADDFFWVTDDYADRQSHLVVYSVPYTDAGIFSLEGAVAVRDSVMRCNIPGGIEGSYMTTNRRIVLPEYKALNVGGKYVGERRGMWRMENGLMAGPFVCHMRLDKINKRVVFAEGFVYAPHDGKRRLLRKLEASLYTLHLPSDNVLDEVEITL